MPANINTTFQLDKTCEELNETINQAQITNTEFSNHRTAQTADHPDGSITEEKMSSEMKTKLDMAHFHNNLSVLNEFNEDALKTIFFNSQGLISIYKSIEGRFEYSGISNLTLGKTYLFYNDSAEEASDIYKPQSNSYWTIVDSNFNETAFLPKHLYLAEVDIITNLQSANGVKQKEGSIIIKMDLGTNQIPATITEIENGVGENKIVTPNTLNLYMNKNSFVWQPQELGSGTVKCAAVLAGKLFAIKEDGQCVIWSRESNTSTICSIGISSPSKLMIVNGTIVCVGVGGIVKYTVTGGWRTVLSKPGITFTDIVIGKGILVACGTQGTIYMSPNAGTSWLNKETPIASDFSCIEFTDTGFVALSSGKIITSTDANAWVQKTVFDADAFKMTYFPKTKELFVISKTSVGRFSCPNYSLEGTLIYTDYELKDIVCNKNTCLLHGYKNTQMRNSIIFAYTGNRASFFSEAFSHPNNSRFIEVRVLENCFWAYGLGGVFQSVDGEAWIQHNTNFNCTYTNITCSKETLSNQSPKNYYYLFGYLSRNNSVCYVSAHITDAIANISKNTGSLTELTTRNKDNLVSAINELKGQIGSNLYSLTDPDFNTLVESGEYFVSVRLIELSQTIPDYSSYHLPPCATTTQEHGTQAEKNIYDDIKLTVIRDWQDPEAPYPMISSTVRQIAYTVSGVYYRTCNYTMGWDDSTQTVTHRYVWNNWNSHIVF